MPEDTFPTHFLLPASPLDIELILTVSSVLPKKLESFSSKVFLIFSRALEKGRWYMNS